MIKLAVVLQYKSNSIPQAVSKTINPTNPILYSPLPGQGGPGSVPQNRHPLGFSLLPAWKCLIPGERNVHLIGEKPSWTGAQKLSVLNPTACLVNNISFLMQHPSFSVIFFHFTLFKNPIMYIMKHFWGQINGYMVKYPQYSININHFTNRNI